MKKLSLIICAGLLLNMAACKPEKFGPIIDEESFLGNIPALTGDWVLVSAKQTDEEAGIKNSPYISKDITSDFPYTEFKLKLNSASNAPTDFTTTPGNSPKIIPFASGKWEVDNIAAPSQVHFIQGTDTLKAKFGSYPSAFSPNFKLKVDRVNAESGKVTMTYEYEFTKQ